MGFNSDELGKILIRNFLLTIIEDRNLKVEAVFLVNAAVKLACENSHVLDALGELENNGAKIYSCGTCLDYFSLKEKIKIGAAGNMKLLCERLCDENTFIIRP
jgi:intracellular sulfur oxidation DsrE/DsrF family protein